MPEATLPTSATPQGASRAAAAPASLSRLVTGLLVMTLAACTSRLLLDESVIDAPQWAWLPLLLAVAWVARTLGTAVAFTAWLMVPGFFGATPWNSPVRASFGGPDLPLFVFDLSLVFALITAAITALLRPRSAVGRLLRSRWPLFVIVFAMLLLKVAQGGGSAETLRNAALFFYGPAVVMGALLAAEQLDLKHLVPQAYLRMLALCALIPGLVLLGLALGLRSWLLVDLGRQDLARPVGVLDWLPPGSLVLLGFCAAGFLPSRETPWTWRLPLLLLLAYDAATYLNRALWIGIACGLALHWAVVRGWWRGFVPLLMVVVALGMSMETLREQVGEGHYQSSEWRLLAWTLTSAAILDQPLIGHDYSESLLSQVLVLPESLRSMQEADLSISVEARSPHNSYLSLLFFGGVVQGGAVMVFIVHALVRLARAIAALRRRGRCIPMADAVLRGGTAVTVYAGFNVVLETPIEGLAFWMIFVPVWLWGTHLRALLADGPPGTGAGTATPAAAPR